MSLGSLKVTLLLLIVLKIDYNTANRFEASCFAAKKPRISQLTDNGLKRYLYLTGLTGKSSS
jgi:hypothetical protein